MTAGVSNVSSRFTVVHLFGTTAAVDNNITIKRPGILKLLLKKVLIFLILKCLNTHLLRSLPAREGKKDNNWSPISDHLVFFVNGISLTRPSLTNLS